MKENYHAIVIAILLPALAFSPESQVASSARRKQAAAVTRGTAALITNQPQAARAPDNTARLKSRAEGTWIKEGAAECLCGQCLDVRFDREIDFCVEDNQIWVSAFYELDAARKQLKLFFKKPGDLGVGGASLPWETYDRGKPLGTIDISELEEGSIVVKWLGFTEGGKPNEGDRQYGASYAGRYVRQGVGGGSEAGAKDFATFLADLRTAVRGHDRTALRAMMSPGFSSEFGEGPEPLIQAVARGGAFNWSFFGRLLARKARPGGKAGDRVPTMFISYDACSATFEFNPGGGWRWKAFVCGDD